MTTNVFKKVRSVAVPVTDQDRTKSVLEQLGFTVSMDTELRPGFRWIEMDLPGKHASVSLVQTGPELPTGVDTGIRLETDDARAARGSRRGRRARRGRPSRLARRAADVLVRRP